MRYVDGFVVPVRKKNVKAYCRMSQQAGKVWRRLGALEYLECVGDDLAVKFGLPFAKLARLRRGETVFFSVIVYRSRAHRDRVNAKVMKDPKIQDMMKGRKMPFDIKRMSYGGFKALVDV
jgi:uncharacterized protein YbaA (DUF1428 family)